MLGIFWFLVRLYIAKVNHDPFLFQIPRSMAWRYFLVSLVDLEANFFFILAYQYTSIVSIQLLDCFSLPCVILISVMFFNGSYKNFQFIAVAVCIAGVVLLVLADHHYQSTESSRASPLIGDLFALLGASMYALSSTLVEKISKSEFGSRSKNVSVVIELNCVMGVIGWVLAYIQAFLLGEFQNLSATPRDSSIGSFFFGFAFSVFSFYSIAPFLLRFSSAAVMNISLMTADFWSIVAAFLIFSHEFHFLYFVSLMIVLGSIFLYHKEDLSRKRRKSPYRFHKIEV
jgi:solute carrier family 35 protein F1/2